VFLQSSDDCRSDARRALLPSIRAMPLLRGHQIKEAVANRRRLGLIRLRPGKYFGQLRLHCHQDRARSNLWNTEIAIRSKPRSESQRLGEPEQIIGRPLLRSGTAHWTNGRRCRLRIYSPAVAAKADRAHWPQRIRDLHDGIALRPVIDDARRRVNEAVLDGSAPGAN